MIDRRQFAAGAVSSFLALQSRRSFGALNLVATPLPLRDGQEFKLQAPVGNEFFAWPRTLLSYPLEGVGQIDPGGCRLLCVETGEATSFQVVKATKQEESSELLFFSDLPTDAVRTYRLTRGTAVAKADGRLTISKEMHRITIDLGPMQVRIPASQSVSGVAPGPILEVARGGKWTGESKVHIEGHSISSILTEELESGPLCSSHRITYATSSGLKYIATIECTVGMDFVRLHEDMERLPADVQGEFDFAWSGRDFAYRQSPNHPYNFPQKPLAKYKDYPWEKIAPAHMDTQFGVSPGIGATGKMPFSLRIYEPWADVSAASFANFWGDTSSDAAGIFIDHLEEWEDHEYALWRASSRSAVDFYYRKPTLHFVWKIARGTRSTCVSIYDHAKDIEVMHGLERDSRGLGEDRGTSGHTGMFPSSHALVMQNWHGTLNLDKTKDWQLIYPSGAAVPAPLFKESPFKSAAEYDRSISGSGFLTQLALSGVRQNHGFGPTSSRQIMESWVPGYQIFRSQFTPAQRERLEAILLLMAYVHAGEDYMPMQRMLAGHPNFLSDVKSTPPGMAFLFPEHREADTWADEWEAYLRLNSRYHTRPEVKAWSTRGGRWTENLGTYVWAFLRPALRASFLLKERDGHERLCTPQIVMLGDWLVYALSAPFDGETPATMKKIAEESARNEGAQRHYWGVVSPADAPRRVHPPMGAHSERRKTPRTMWYMGTAMRNYSPLTGEYLMWASRPTDQDMELPLSEPDPYSVMFNGPDNRGTNPHLRTAKYTGFGITMRAAVDSPRELSVHLLQIDDGPNYRWGDASEGSCGVLYFFANGKGYSHNGTEDAGDRVDQDTDFSTNFGVWKDGVFRAIGQNVLSRPLYDLSFAQFAEVVPREGELAYSWPEYVSRSILLAGDDYFILHDKVFNPEINHRFSWFVRKGDAFPHISLLTGSRSHEDDRFTSVETVSTSGRWADGTGDSIALITHKEGIHAEPAPFGGRITTHDGSDLVFASAQEVMFQEGKSAFTGTAGILRNRADGVEMALFHGTHIAAAGLSFTTTNTDLGISARVPKSGAAWGYFFSQSDTEVSIGLPEHSEKMVLYIDGRRTAGVQGANQLSTKLLAGRHRWELTASQPVPLEPSVIFTESIDSGAIVHGTPVASATSYDAEISADEAKTWKTFGTATEPVFKISGLINETKYHVRITARNVEHASAPGPEYPIYATKRPPLPPDGLYVELMAGVANLTWGEVLGVTEYRLYRKKKGEAQFHIAYAGRTTAWKDVDAAIVAPAASPVDTLADRGSDAVIEYYVTSTSHNGESKPSRQANTDPTSWRNWNPTDGEPFRRVVERTKGGLPNDGGGLYYPR